LHVLLSNVQHWSGEAHGVKDSQQLCPDCPQAWHVPPLPNEPPTQLLPDVQFPPPMPPGQHGCPLAPHAAHPLPAVQ
jgi:hypothetical protein